MFVVKLAVQVLVVALSSLLTLLILMHKGRGGGLSGMFSDAAGNAGASGVAERNLNRWTVVMAMLWVTLIVVLDLMAKSGV